MKTTLLSFATLLLLSHGLRVADHGPKKVPEVMTPEKVSYKATHMPQEKYGILTYNTTNGMEFLDFLTGNASWHIRSVLTGKSETAQGKSIIMRAHRRSGIQLAKNVSNCVAKHVDPDVIARVVLFPRTLEGEFTDENLASSKTPTLHFVRNPVDWVISWYQFVRQEGWLSDDWQYIDWSSDWMTRRGSMKETHGEDEDLTAFLQSRGQWIDYDEPINKFINRVSPEIGLAVAYREMTTDVFPQAVKFSNACKQNEMCKQVCLESFTSSQESYMTTWWSVFNYLLDVNIQAKKYRGLRQCIEAQREFNYPSEVKMVGDIRRETALSGIDTGRWGVTKLGDKLRAQYYGILHDLDGEFGWELQNIMKNKNFHCDL